MTDLTKRVAELEAENARLRQENARLKSPDFWWDPDAEGPPQSPEEWAEQAWDSNYDSRDPCNNIGLLELQTARSLQDEYYVYLADNPGASLADFHLINFPDPNAAQTYIEIARFAITAVSFLIALPTRKALETNDG